MMRSLFSAVSGLSGNMLRMDVIGNNIANVNTIGFKAGRVNFEEALAQMRKAATAPTDNVGGTNPIQVGTGSLVGTVNQLYTQGSLQMTGIGTDLAIQGNGLFVLSNGEMLFYTRDGSFQMDSRGRLVSPSSGYVVQGYEYDRETETYGASLTDITLPVKDVDPAKATTEILLRGNLNADSEPVGSAFQTGALYGAGGSLATGETALVDLREDETGIIPLLNEGDTVNFSATVGGDIVSGSLEVTASTTLSDLLTALADTLNSPDGISGITAHVGSDGKIYVESPDELGTTAEIDSLTVTAVDQNGETCNEFSAAMIFTETETARDAAQLVEETTVYDSLGFAHVVKFTFTRVMGSNEFTWEAEIDGGEAEILQGGSGRVTFRADGSLDNLTYDPVNNRVPTSLRFDPGTGADSPVTITLNGGTRGAFDGLTMLSGSPSLESSQDGYAKGAFTNFQIDEQGRIMAIFSNGVIRPIARLALAEFMNPGGLTRVANNAYIENPNSGQPTIGASGEGINSTVTAGALEQSNVDLAKEFTDMIVAQRGFQANARVITTSDDVLTDLINIKR